MFWTVLVSVLCLLSLFPFFSQMPAVYLLYRPMELPFLSEFMVLTMVAKVRVSFINSQSYGENPGVLINSLSRSVSTCFVYGWCDLF